MTQDGSMPDPQASNDHNRHGAIRQDVLQVIDETTGIVIESAESSVPFVELGFDSLCLTQLAIQLRQKYQIELTFRQLMETQSTLDSLVEFLVDELPDAPGDPEGVGKGGSQSAAMPCSSTSMARRCPTREPRSRANGSREATTRRGPRPAS